MEGWMIGGNLVSCGVAKGGFGEGRLELVL